MEVIGFALGILIGITLGLIGSGGSIFAIPILVYVMHIAPIDATTYSLFIVGIAALVGSIKGMRANLLDYKMTLYFGLPSVISIFIMRKFVMPIFPSILFNIHDFVVTKDLLIMLVFAGLMIIASLSMIFNKATLDSKPEEIRKETIIIKGVFVGLLTGFVGVGGGFLIIPILIFSGKLPMQKAVVTSLLIIAANSLIGFVGSLNGNPIHWAFLLEFTAFAIAGIYVGMYLSNKISNEKLKPVFGWFVLITGVYIIIKELFCVYN